jgi:hypothetical protein
LRAVVGTADVMMSHVGLVGVFEVYSAVILADLMTAVREMAYLQIDLISGLMPFPQVCHLGPFDCVA